MNGDHADRPVPTGTRFVIYRADSENGSCPDSEHGKASIAGSHSSTRRQYIEPESGRKDMLFILLFVLVMLCFLALTGYGCYLAYKPLLGIGNSAYGIIETDRISLPMMLLLTFSVALLAGLLTLLAAATLAFAPKFTYQAVTLLSPLAYLALSLSIYFVWRGVASAAILLALFLLHAIYLVARRRHIKMYRSMLREAAAVGSARDRYLTPVVLWVFVMCVTALSMAGAFGFFKLYLDHYGSNGALYAFFFSVVVFGWLWIINLVRNQYKMVVSGLCLNDLLREGSVHEATDKLRGKMWRYVTGRFLGQALHGSFVVSLGELFVLMVLFMRYERIDNLIGYMMLLCVCQHIVDMVVKQTGLIHSIMFGSSYFDGTFDVYVPFVFYDELCSHVTAMLALLSVGASSAIAGRVAALYIHGERARATTVFLSTVGAYIALTTSSLFLEHVRSVVTTHIVCYGENPVIMGRTSPVFTEAVRAVQLADDPSLTDTA